MCVARWVAGTLLAVAACAGNPVETEGSPAESSSSGEIVTTDVDPDGTEAGSSAPSDSTSTSASSDDGDPLPESTSSSSGETSTSTGIDAQDSSEADSADEPPDTWGPDHLPPRCGWDPSDGWYECYGYGLAPDERGSEINCPPGLREGASCEGLLGDDGCCDAQGDLWYCTGNEVVALQFCVE